MKIFWIGLVLCVLGACEKLEWSPHQTDLNSLPKEVNATNLQRLKSQENPEQRTIRIAFTGDSQRYYDEAEALVKKLNTMDAIDFVILAGDISDFGLQKEFEWIHDTFSKLKQPYFAVIGNHDYVGNGEKVYDHLYGPRNFSFVYKGVKFVFHDTNGRENRFNRSVPDLNWLANELNVDSTVSKIIPVSHVQPYDADFDPALEEPYVNLLHTNKKINTSLHGHHHSSHDFYPYNDHVRYINSNALNKRTFLLLEITNGTLTKSLIPY